MEWCPECGSLMLPSTQDGKKVFKCKCGYVKPFSEEKSEAYKLRQKIKNEEKPTSTKEILEWKEKNLQSALKNFRCPNCGYDKCSLKTMQTRSADEGMTHFIVCLKCGRMIKIGS